MPVCANCGQQNPDGFRICGMCGQPLAPTLDEQRRKVVTIVFSDIAGSTAIGEQLDPETLRRVLSRYFDVARATLERHGGSVEKFIGDAVLAVFGIPTLHEDDALRAVRAADEMRTVIARLNDELAAEYGVRLETRIGVNTGEVVVGDSADAQRLATGDAMNVAARLEQAAGKGEVLLGPNTYALVRDAVDAEALEPLALKGKRLPLEAWRLVRVREELPPPRPISATPFVGRDEELAALLESLDAAIASRSSRLCIVAGPPGIGKSRLVRELLVAVGKRVRVTVGRCLPYGEGITYWPLAEIVKAVAGDDPQPRLEALFADEHGAVAASRIAAAIGVAEAGARPEEIAWAFRKLFETLARERPLIVVVDDIHWAESALLDLLDYVLSFATDAPILLVCPTRPDLFDEHPAWAAPRPNARVIPLAPLEVDAAEDLVDRLLATRPMTKERRAQIVDAAEGNPLFVEQMLALETDQPGSDRPVPTGLRALLAARLDRLDAGEKTVIEHAAIEGRTFHRGGLVEILPAEVKGAVSSSLMALIRKEFIRPDQPIFIGDDAFRFGHILIRDAAYDSLPKRLRADLHERFADWLEEAAGEQLAEYEEIVAYHLEQAHDYQSAVGSPTNGTRRLAERTVARLTSAGRRALVKGDLPAAIKLLERADRLFVGGESEHAELLLDLGDTLRRLGELTRADEVLADADARARSSDHTRVRTAVEAQRAFIASLRRPTALPTLEMRDVVVRAADELERRGDIRGAAAALTMATAANVWLVENARAVVTGERALALARAVGAHAEEVEALEWTSFAMWVGPMPIHDFRVWNERLLVEYHGDPTVEWFLALGLGVALGAEGQFGVAREWLSRGRRLSGELGLVTGQASTAMQVADLELFAGDLEAAERDLRWGLERYREIVDTGMTDAHYLLSLEAYLLDVVSRGGPTDDAEALFADCARAAPEDLQVQVLTLRSRARLLAHARRLEDAERVARDAVRTVEHTDGPKDHADTLVVLAEVLERAGRVNEAADVARDALLLYEQKGVVVSAARTREWLLRLDAPPVS